MTTRQVIKELPSQVLQRRMLKIRLEELSKEDLIEHVDFLMSAYNKTFNQVRVDYLIYEMKLPENHPTVMSFFNTVECEELQNGN
jgi:RNA-binding protein YhbY